MITPELARAVSGLRPQAWLVVGTGWVREDIKTQLLERGAALRGDVVLKTDEIATRILGLESSAKRPALLSSMARQEALRFLLELFRSPGRLPELKRLRRQGGFFKRLDRAVQAVRSVAAGPEELGVLLGRLSERGTLRTVQKEVIELAEVYGDWMEKMSLWDSPRALAAARDRLDGASGSDQRIQWPEKIFWLNAAPPEGLERSFMDALGRHVELAVLTTAAPARSEGDAPGFAGVASGSPIDWRSWHTLDDAAEALADRISGNSEGHESTERDWAAHTVLIPDDPAVRRSIRRVFGERGIPLADPRDPTVLRWHETLKWAMLPLEVVGRDFDRSDVIAWLQPDPVIGATLADRVAEHGIRQGLSSYRVAGMEDAFKRLVELKSKLGGKRECRELARIHLEILAQSVASEHQWVIEFFEGFWDRFCSDIERIGMGSRRAATLYWLERARVRLEGEVPPPSSVRPRSGVGLYRLGQWPDRSVRELWLFGIPARALDSLRTGDLAFSEREREFLESEFDVTGPHKARDTLERGLKAWISLAEQVHISDAEYDWSGSERESTAPLWIELGLITQDSDNGTHEPVSMGADPRWLPSYDSIRPLPAQEIRLPSPPTSIPASHLDNYSRCAFIALARHRWRLKRVRQAEAELWPDVRGRILHLAVEMLFKSRPDGLGMPTLAAEAALHEAWRVIGPRGLLRSPRLEVYAKERLLKTLNLFLEHERVFQERAGTKTIHLEGPRMEITIGGATVIGIPDRIEEHADGVFVIDYKTKADVPKGKQIVELGYGVQLPLYALGASQVMGKRVIGLQYVALAKDAARRAGVFFSEWNGKEPGSLTNSKGNNTSLMREMQPEDAWSKCAEHLTRHVESWLQGKFDPSPTLTTDCPRCEFRTACGRRRRDQVEGSGNE